MQLDHWNSAHASIVTIVLITVSMFTYLPGTGRFDHLRLVLNARWLQCDSVLLEFCWVPFCPPPPATHPQPLDASPGDLLAVVELDAVQAVAALQMLQWGIRDQGAVVQLDHLQPVVGTGAATQVSDAVVSDQLTVRKTLEGPGEG